MQTRVIRPGPTASPGRHKRPRLSEPTTAIEHAAAHVTITEDNGANTALLSADGQAASSTLPIRRRSASGHDKSDPRSTDEKWLSRVRAIEAALSSDLGSTASQMQDPNIPTSNQAPQISQASIMPSAEGSKGAPKHSRLQAIEDALRQTTGALTKARSDDVLPSSQPEADGQATQLSLASADGAHRITDVEELSNQQAAHMNLPPSSPPLALPLKVVRSTDEVACHDFTRVHAGTDSVQDMDVEDALPKPRPRTHTSASRDSREPEQDDVYDSHMNADLLLDMPGPTSAPTFVTFSRTATGFQTISASSKWSISEEKVRQQQERFERWEKEAEARGRDEVAMEQDYPDVVPPVGPASLPAHAASSVDEGKVAGTVSNVPNRVPLSEVSNVSTDFSRFTGHDSPSEPHRPLLQSGSTSRNPFSRTALEHTNPNRNPSMRSSVTASALPARLLPTHAGMSTPVPHASSRSALSTSVSHQQTLSSSSIGMSRFASQPSTPLHPTAGYPAASSTPFEPGVSTFNPAARAMGLGGRTPARSGAKKFVTPFRTDAQAVPGTPLGAERKVNYGTPIAKPSKSEPLRLKVVKLDPLQSERPAPGSIAPGASRVNLSKRVFDLENGPRCRKSMETYGLRPEGFTRQCLAHEYNCPPEIFLITPSTAAYYAFYSPLNPDLRLDPAEAHSYLLRAGCSLATREWVDNHWGLILWKLAGLVRACPSELDTRWSWEEVTRQLLYRYEREINRGQRPPVRKIHEQDTPSARPMVLTVCEMSWTEERTTAEGERIEAHPDFVLTDGWYKIRATADEALARAARKCKLQVGSKIAMSGIKLDGKREGTEVLRALDSSRLMLAGNSTSLARWHTKLGFQPLPFVATLSSLSPDGGPVMLLDLVITRIFPMGYLDAEGEDGERPIPRSENEEAALDAEWQKLRATEEAKVREEIERRLFKLESLVERLDRASGYAPLPENDSQPDTIDDLFEELEETSDTSAFIAARSQAEKIWLAHLARSKCMDDRNKMAEEVEGEVKARCPAREVRNFRVVRVEDARTNNRAPMRMAQLTVWDVLSMGEGALRVGKRYLVTNLIPSQKGSWRGPDVEGEIFLSTRRETRWTSVD